MENLDRLCAEYGHKFADKVSRIIFQLRDIPREIINDLERGSLHQRLIREFNARKIKLNNMSIEKENTIKWRIKSDRGNFIIEEEAGFLSVYKEDLTVSDAKKAETLITKALGVLQEQGLYAFVLFCESRGSAEKDGAEKIKDITRKLLKDKLNLINGNDLLKAIREEDGLASKLEDLMLAIQVLEKSLIYARYHAKALSDSQEKTEAIKGEAT